MIEHVNFYEKSAFVLTYRKIAASGIALAGILGLLYGFLWLRGEFIEKKIIKMTEEVNQLKIMQEELFSQTEADKAISGPELVRQYFNRSPRWSHVLGRMVGIMPSGVWLVSLKSYEKMDLASGRGLLLSGEAKEARDVSLFLEDLDSSPFFVNPILTDSKQEQRGTTRVFTFTIDMGIRSLTSRL